MSKISPVEAVRYTDSTVNSRKKAKKTRRVTTLSMAWDNIKRTPKKTASVIVSLSLSMILLNGTFTLVNGFDMDKYIENQAVSDFYITDASVINLNSTAKIYNGVSKELRDEIKAMDGITEFGSVYMQETQHKFNETGAENAKNIYEEYKELMPMPYAEEQARRLNEDGLIDAHLYGVDDFITEKLEIADGEFDLEKFKTGEFVIASSFIDTGDGRYYDIGDKVPVDFGNGNIKEYEVMAIGDIPYALGPQHSHYFDLYLTLPADEFIAQTGETGALKTAYNAEESAIPALEEWIENYCENVDPNMAYQSRKTFAAEFESLQNMYLTVGGLLSFILALIGILNFINSVITSVQTRRQELAVLQSIGMTGKQLRQMLIGEGVWYTVITVLIALTVGSLITYGMVMGIASQMWFFSYHFIITPILLCIPALVVLSVLIPVLCYRNMCRQSVVDRLRESE